MPTQEELDRMVEHLSYEFWMLTGATFVLATRFSHPEYRDSTIELIKLNASLEAMLIHARSLIQFLFNREGSGDTPDLRSDDFLTHLTKEQDSEWKRQRNKYGSQQDWQEVVNKILLRLSTLTLKG